MKAERTFTVYPDASGKWRWREKTRNGRIVSCSGESFSSKRKAHEAALRESLIRDCMSLVKCHGETFAVATPAVKRAGSAG